MKVKAHTLLVMFVLWLLLLFSSAMLFDVLVNGQQVYDLVSVHLLKVKIGLSFRFDALSSLMFSMVSMIAVVVGHYSVRYLDGEPRQAYFYRHLLGLILCVSCLMLANNLILFAFMWLLVSHHLRRLLLFYPKRPNAVAAAYKKRLVAMLGDVLLFGAICSIVWEFQTTELSEIFSDHSLHLSAMNTQVIGVLLALCAIAKSAQFPFHFWLPETMETPTPVSALMHAGVINAGGFLIIRFSPILQDATIAHGLLSLVGAFTAVYASLIMITQTNIKAKLAFSTIGQMGFMLFACGLGAYGLALFHIIAHSFYKSHAFLSTGQLVEESKKIGFKLQAASRSLTLALVACIVLAFSYSAIFLQGQFLALIAYFSIMVLSLGQNRLSSKHKELNFIKVYGAVLAILLFGLLTYIGIETGMAHFLIQTIPSMNLSKSMAVTTLPVVSIAISFFVFGFILSSKLIDPKTEFIKKVYVHLWNAGYFSQMSDRLLIKKKMRKSVSSI